MKKILNGLNKISYLPAYKIFLGEIAMNDIVATEENVPILQRQTSLSKKWKMQVQNF